MTAWKRAMKFDDILEKLDGKTRARLVAAALYFPRLARGHGGLRRYGDGTFSCNAAGCRLGESHIQERMELAYKAMYGH